MKTLLQRVSRSTVSIEGETVGSIGRGLLVLVGVATGDNEEDIDYLLSKILNLRIFPDVEGRFDRSVLEIKGELLLVSQFTLLADTKKGRRPGFSGAAPPTEAKRLFDLFTKKAEASGLKVAGGRFQAYMAVSLVNDGPVTIMLDSRQKS
jgi:D-tyrosyl-tRNA(Tyr) deacylase